jgi:hypothetical protein
MSDVDIPIENKQARGGELDRLAEHHDESMIISNFIDWLIDEDGKEICKFHADDDAYYPIRKNGETLIAKYFDIDMVKVEKERRALLEKIRGKQ